MRAPAVAVVCAIAACRDPAPPPPSTTRAPLADYLATVAGTDEDSRAREVASWQLDRATWERTVAAAYAGVHADYAREFAAVAPALVARLATRGAITTRAHFAGDPKLTLGQAQARWALPVQYPSELADLDGTALDAVFVRDGERWRAIVGIDRVVRAKVAALDPACAAHLDGARSGRCAEVGWVIADAALAADPARLAHACSLATTVCPK